MHSFAEGIHGKRLKQGRGPVGKQAVIGARERGGSVKARAISTTDAGTLKGFVHEHIKPGSTVYTDDHRGYCGLDGVFYSHASVKHSAKEYVNGMIHTNGIESVWALIKRGYTSTFHHFSVKHLHRYVDEFVSRHNMRDLDTLDQMALIAGKMENAQLRYKDLVA